MSALGRSYLWIVAARLHSRRSCYSAAWDLPSSDFDLNRGRGALSRHGTEAGVLDRFFSRLHELNTQEDLAVRYESLTCTTEAL